jgi:hypothetical protein
VLCDSLIDSACDGIKDWNCAENNPAGMPEAILQSDVEIDAGHKSHVGEMAYLAGSDALYKSVVNGNCAQFPFTTDL